MRNTPCPEGRLRGGGGEGGEGAVLVQAHADPALGGVRGPTVNQSNLFYLKDIDFI